MVHSGARERFLDRSTGYWGNSRDFQSWDNARYFEKSKPEDLEFPLISWALGWHLGHERLGTYFLIGLFIVLIFGISILEGAWKPDHLQTRWTWRKIWSNYLGIYGPDNLGTLGFLHDF